MIHVVVALLALSLNNTPTGAGPRSGSIKYPPRTSTPKPPPPDKPSEDRPDPPPRDEEEPRPTRPDRDEPSPGQLPQSREEPYLTVIRRNMAQVESCFDRARTWSPALQGEVVVEWEISPDGEVGKAEVTGNTTRNADLASCILQAVKGWRFSDPNASYPSHVRHSFRFQSS
jgi:hypothetical protein